MGCPKWHPNPDFSAWAVEKNGGRGKQSREEMSLPKETVQKKVEELF